MKCSNIFPPAQALKTNSVNNAAKPTSRSQIITSRYSPTGFWGKSYNNFTLFCPREIYELATLFHFCLHTLSIREKYKYKKATLMVYNSPRREEIGARASIRMCAFVCMSDCSYLFEIARAIQDLSIRNTEFLFAEARQTSHLGQNRVKQSYDSKR